MAAQRTFCLMRLALAGIMLLLAPAAAVFGQASGSVETIGFGESVGVYRSGCWTPMLVYLTSEKEKPDDYTIQVHQEDLDGDKVLYSKRITLSGNPGGGAAQPQIFWMYFLPKPTGHGLPQQGLSDQQGAIKVYLCNREGTKQIKALPLQKGYVDLDPYKSPYNANRGTRLVLVLNDRTSSTRMIDTMEYGGAAGLMEDVRFQPITPDRLPENPIAYEAVDAILWLDCDPSQAIMEEKLPAIKAWVRRGGKLVVCQREQWKATSEKLGSDLLPVIFPQVPTKDGVQQGMFSHKTLEPLARMAGYGKPPAPWETTGPHIPWWKEGDYRMARAQLPLGSDAVVEESIDWSDGLEPSRTPYLARKLYGLGSVTWVAQDLSDPAFRWMGLRGWSKIWDHVFGWNNQTVPMAKQGDSDQTKKDAETAKRFYEDAAGVDVGGSFVRQMEHQGTVSFLVFLSVIFFLVYFVLAGPVSYFVLRQRKQAHLSWFVFGASALIALGLTMGVVKLILRGGPEVKHVTLIRQLPGTITTVESRIGLYIPQDGMQEVSLDDDPGKSGSAREGSYITPFPIHPFHLGEGGGDAGGEYAVAVREMTADKPMAIEFPYRRSLKKIKVDWAGEGVARAALITGTPLARQKGQTWQLSGKLTNKTGQNLVGVYLAYTWGKAGDDYMFYLPYWKAGDVLDLADCEKFDFTSSTKGRLDASARGAIGTSDFNTVSSGWGKIFVGDRLRGWNYETDDSGNSGGICPTAFPTASLFDRMPVMRVTDQAAMVPGQNRRWEILRRGVRQWDMSNAVGAGGLVILAAAEDKGPVPLPVKVEGNTPSGSGTVFYQVVLPMQREYEKIGKPATTRSAEK